MKRMIWTIGLSTALTISAAGAFAQSDAQKTMDKNMQNAKEVYDRQAAEKDKEAMRDKSHDGRVPVNDHTSVGAKQEPGGGSVNVKVTEKPKK